ncbi:MAG: SusC/RagA family TonB-linked outer membrane protein [Muribaculaceae bacterium]|nr:SusC/RagA family TonB-linked outer membrane protein [Muribaculaceae bacterium]
MKDFMKQRINIIAVCAAISMASSAAIAQDAANPLKIRGTVLDSDGIPVAGAMVKSSNNGNEAVTDIDGNYEITVTDGSKSLNYNFIGYKTRTISVSKAAENGIVSMGEPSGSLDEIIDLGYYKVTRRELTGAVSVVGGTELAKSPESNLGKTFAGRLPGLTVMEENGEPGLVAQSSSNNGLTMIIRGLTTANGNKPLIIIDGQISPNENYMYITPEEIETVTVLKDASAMAIYGMQGGNGAIVIRTKSGRIGANKVSVYFDEALQQSSKTPYSISAAEYATLRNQAGYNDGLGKFSQFSQEQIDGYSATNHAYNPYNDLFNKTMWMTRAGMSLTGGTERLQYYANVNYMHESSPFKAEENKDWEYNPAPGIDRFNFRSNIDVKINSWLSAMMRISGSINRVKTAGSTNASVYSALFKLPPTMYGSLSTVVNDEEGNIVHKGNEVLTVDGVTDPVYGMLNRSGFIEQLKADVLSMGGLNADLSMVTEGLSASAVVAYQLSSNNNQSTLQKYQRWIAVQNGDEVNFQRLGSDENTPLSYAKTRQMYYNLNLSAFANYKRTFGDHYVSSMAYIFYQDLQTESTSGAAILPYKRESMGITATYGFKNRYFIRGDVAYSGSEQFHPDHRWYTTPSVSGTWIASDESFIQGIKPWVSLVKLRLSYGLNDNDQLGDGRMLYADNVDYQGNEFTRGNPLLAPEKIYKTNYGIDLGFFDNDLSVSFDYFRQHCDNVLISSSTLVPSFQGVPLDYYPLVNEGRIKNHGFEVAALYHKAINRDWTVFVGGSFSYNKNEMVYMKEVIRDGYAYPYAKAGQSIGQKWGYLIDYSNGNGMFNFSDEISGCGLDYSALGTPRPGDFKYVDLNKDGKIDSKDRAPIGYGDIPRGYYSINGGFAYKNFEVSFLFQGTTKRSITLSGVGAFETENQGVFNDIHMNAWTEDRWNAGEKIDYPALSLSKSTSHNDNDYFIQDGSYLRLKNAEIAYTLPHKISKKAFAEKIRFALNGQNLFTIDHLRSKHIDAEIGKLSAFPTYRVINLGVKVTF